MTHPLVTLRLPAAIPWIPLAQEMVAQAGPILGLDPKRTYFLKMATEEIIAHLAATSPDTPIEFSLIPGLWHVQALFSFTADPSDLWAMNLISASEVHEDQEMTHLGLLLASRVVDGFSVRLAHRTIHLSLRQDLSYPVLTPDPGHRADPVTRPVIAQRPESALIQAAVARTLSLYPPHVRHPAFITPGKIADMVAGGDLNVAVALDPRNAATGMMVWHEISDRAIGYWGPYVFDTGNQTASLLTRHLIQCAARTAALGIFSERATADMPDGEFERLDEQTRELPDGTRETQTVWFRHLREDTGAMVWAHPDVMGFLESFFSRHVLMRDIQRVADHLGESLPARTVLSCALSRECHEATLVPMVSGADARTCIDAHVRALREESTDSILFRLDLGAGWQAALGGVLMAAGFVPRYVLPGGGKSDILVMRHEI